jgi:hypothetical protein
LYTINIIKKDEQKNESLLNINENKDEEKDILINQSNLIDNINEETKQQKLAVEGYEVLSKDELETK